MPRKVESHRPRRVLPSATVKRPYEDRAFYNRRAWRDGVRLSKLRQDPLCEKCKAAGRLVAATHVHHLVEVRDDPNLALDLSNLESLCTPCHTREHNARRAGAEEGHG